MSISDNVGGMSRYLGNIRTAESYTELKMNVTNTLKKLPKIGEGMVNAIHRTKNGIKQFIIPGMLFENMGLTYLGPVDGHNVPQMVKLFSGGASRGRPGDRSCPDQERKGVRTCHASSGTLSWGQHRLRLKQEFR